jgi:hypothetical protein
MSQVTNIVPEIRRTSPAADRQRTNRDAGRSVRVPPAGRSTFSTDRKRAGLRAESSRLLSDANPRREAGRSTYPRHHLLIAALCCWVVTLIIWWLV